METKKESNDSAYGDSRNGHSYGSRSSTNSSECGAIRNSYTAGAYSENSNFVPINYEEITEQEPREEIPPSGLDGTNEDKYRQVAEGKIANSSNDALHLALLSQTLNCVAKGSDNPLVSAINGITIDKDKQSTLKDLIASMESKEEFYSIISFQDGIILYTTEKLSCVLGFPKDMWTGRSFIDLVHPKDRVAFASFITKDAVTVEPTDNVGGKGKQNSFYCRLRRYRGLKTGYSVTNKKVLYIPCELKLSIRGSSTTKNDDNSPQKTERHSNSGAKDNESSPQIKSAEKQIFLVVSAYPVSSAYNAPNEEVRSVKFCLRHSASMQITHVESDVVPLLGYLPQDMITQPIFKFYHPEDALFLKDTYGKTLKGHGTPLRSMPFRFLCQNGSYISVFAEFSYFINPWSKRIEFIIAQYHILKGPDNPDVVTPLEEEKAQNFAEEVLFQRNVIEDEILNMLNQEYESSNEVSLQDSESSPLSYNQLNYNDNLKRFFESKPKVTMSDESNDSSNKNDVSSMKVHAVEETDNTCPPSPSVDNDLRSSFSYDGGFMDHMMSTILTTASEHDTTAITTPTSFHLTEAILCKHNDHMKKQMLQKYREEKCKESVAKPKRSIIKQAEGPPRGIKRTGTHSEKEFKATKQDIDKCSSGASQIADQLITSIHNTYDNESATLNATNTNSSTTHASNDNNGNSDRMHSTLLALSQYTSMVNGDHVNHEQLCPKSEQPSVPLDEIERMIQLVSPLNVENMLKDITTSESRSCFETQLSHDARYTEQCLSQLGKKADNERVKEFISSLDSFRNQDQEDGGIQTTANPDSSRGSSVSSNSSSLYSSFLDDSVSAIDTNASSSSLSSMDLCDGQRLRRYATRNEYLNNSEDYGLISVVQKEPPWQRDIVMTPYLVYQYQIANQKLDDVLDNDLQMLKRLQQPAVVIDQLNQLFVEMKVNGSKQYLTFEEGLTSSSSSDEEEPSYEKFYRKETKYNKMSFLYEENAPLPPPYLSKTNSSRIPEPLAVKKN